MNRILFVTFVELTRMMTGGLHGQANSNWAADRYLNNKYDLIRHLIPPSEWTVDLNLPD